MDKRLEDRIAIITGAASGIGRATAIRFAASGARVVCADLKDSDVTEHIQQKYGQDRAIFVACNVTSEDQIQNLVQEAVKWGGRLDVLCNIAGILTEISSRLTQRAHETATEDFDRTWAVNTRGVWLCCKYALQTMLVQEPRPPNARGERTRGKIINAASIAGLVATPHAACYVPSKHAVVGLTKQIAIDYARDRIHCNCICPGSVNTPMIKPLIPTSGAETVSGSFPPWDAIANPEDIADAALFLASDESSYMNGHSMVVDGGFTAQ